jgi:hypothetical protein
LTSSIDLLYKEGEKNTVTYQTPNCSISMHWIESFS